MENSQFVVNFLSSIFVKYVFEIKKKTYEIRDLYFPKLFLAINNNL